MTRKDYAKFAEVIRASKARYEKVANLPRGATAQEVSRFFETKLADIFATDNQRFDRERFYAACEPKEGK